MLLWSSLTFNGAYIVSQCKIWQGSLKETEATLLDQQVFCDSHGLNQMIELNVQMKFSKVVSV